MEIVAVKWLNTRYSLQPCARRQLCSAVYRGAKPMKPSAI